MKARSFVRRVFLVGPFVACPASFVYGPLVWPGAALAAGALVYATHGLYRALYGTTPR